jgi:hypothetical protein
MMRNRSFIALLAAAAAGVAACSGQSPQGGGTPAAGAITLVGAGSTFDYPFFSRAFYEYHKIDPNVSINYQSIGSGGGIQQFTRKTVDFGATDVPMSAKELAAVDGGAAAVLQIPVALGGVAIAYNLPGAPPHVRLSPAALSGIFLGEVHNWSDPAIASINSGARLPDLPIVVVHRADGSGTTFIFTDYLSRVSPEWKAKVGTAKTVAWPATGATSNSPMRSKPAWHTPRCKISKERSRFRRCSRYAQLRPRSRASRRRISRSSTLRERPRTRLPVTRGRCSTGTTQPRKGRPCFAVCFTGWRPMVRSSLQRSITSNFRLR